MTNRLVTSLSQKGRLAAMFHHVAVAILLLASSALADRLHHTLLNSSPTYHLLPSLSQDATLLINRDPTRDVHLTPVPTHLTSLYDLSKTADSLTPTRVLDPSPSKDPRLPNFSPNQDLQLELAPSYELISSSFTSLGHEVNPSPYYITSATDDVTHALSPEVLVPPETDDLITTTHGLNPTSSSDHNITHAPELSFIPSPNDPFLSNNTEAITLPNKNALPSLHHTTQGSAGSTEESGSNNTATITQEEFNSILTR